MWVWEGRETALSFWTSRRPGGSYVDIGLCGLSCHARAIGGGMDHLYWCVRRLTLQALLVLCVMVALTEGARATSCGAQYETSSDAMAACHAFFDGRGNTGYSCTDPGNGSVNGHWLGQDWWFSYCRSSGSTACASVPSISGAFSGKLVSGSPMCQSQADGSGCGMTFTPDSPPFLNRTGTTWATHGTYRPTGSACTPGPVGGDPSSAPAPAQVPVRSCGGGSCYDSAHNQYCAVDESTGSQVCVSGPTAHSQSGGCASAGSTAVCAGTPSAPPPPAPPASPISDPPTEIKASDKYVTSPPSTGNQTTTVNVYGEGSSQPSSGKTSSDDGPAPASSAGTGQGSYSDGGDCNNPPVCSGDAVMCGIARETWRNRCSAKQSADQLHKDLAGTSDAPASGQHSVSEVTDAPVDLGDTSQLDSSGMGWGAACPFQDLSVQVGDTSLTISFQPVCEYGPWMRGFVLLLAAITCAGIIGGFKVGSLFGGGGD